MLFHSHCFIIVVQKPVVVTCDWWLLLCFMNMRTAHTVVAVSCSQWLFSLSPLRVLRYVYTAQCKTDLKYHLHTFQTNHLPASEVPPPWSAVLLPVRVAAATGPFASLLDDSPPSSSAFGATSFRVSTSWEEERRVNGMECFVMNHVITWELFLKT